MWSENSKTETYKISPSHTGEELYPCLGAYSFNVDFEKGGISFSKVAAKVTPATAHWVNILMGWAYNPREQGRTTFIN